MASSRKGRELSNVETNANKNRLETVELSVYNVDFITTLSETTKILHEWNAYCLCLLKITNCNGMCQGNFSDAYCATERYQCLDTQTKELDVKKYSFASIFKFGDNVLKSFSNGARPKHKGVNIALAKLLYFISTEIQCAEKFLSEICKNTSKSEWKLMLLHHLISKLSGSPLYTIDKSQHGIKQNHCPCSCSEQLSGSYGDTSMGCPDVWHGTVDIKMEVCVKSMPDESEDESDSLGGHGNQSSVAIEVNDWKKNRQQIIAQTVVSSFLQKKEHPELRNYLIPTVGFSQEMIVIFFYDCENDMLLESSQMPIFRNGKIVKATVLSLWLALNYKYFCSGLTRGMKESHYKADFFEHVRSKLSCYKENISSPCEIPKPSFERSFNSWTWGGKPEDDDSPVEDVNELVFDENLHQQAN